MLGAVVMQRTLHACAYIEVVLFPQPRGKMTGEEGAPAATTEVEKGESENGECVCVCARVCRLYWKRVRRVMIGRRRTEGKKNEERYRENGIRNRVTRGGRGSDCKWGGTGRGETGVWREGESRQKAGSF